LYFGSAAANVRNMYIFNPHTTTTTQDPTGYTPSIYTNFTHQTRNLTKEGYLVGITRGASNSIKEFLLFKPDSPLSLSSSTYFNAYRASGR
jgi:hypothetical protein